MACVKTSHIEPIRSYTFTVRTRGYNTDDENSEYYIYTSSCYDSYRDESVDKKMFINRSYERSVFRLCESSICSKSNSTYPVYYNAYVIVASTTTETGLASYTFYSKHHGNTAWTEKVSDSNKLTKDQPAKHSHSFYTRRYLFAQYGVDSARS